VRCALVVASPTLDDDLGLAQSVENLAVEQLIAKAGFSLIRDNWMPRHVRVRQPIGCQARLLPLMVQRVVTQSCVRADMMVRTSSGSIRNVRSLSNVAFTGVTPTIASTVLPIAVPAGMLMVTAPALNVYDDNGKCLGTRFLRGESHEAEAKKVLLAKHSGFLGPLPQRKLGIV